MSPSRQSPTRGEIWTVDFGEPVGHEQASRRPAVIVSSDRLNSSRAGLVIVVPLTRTRRALPSHIEIEPGDSGLTEPSYAKAEDVKSISVDRLVRRLGQAQPTVVDEIGRALLLLLELT
ncbi:MAG: type II toxin-antitoxin system PemK/MazF family toxin [Acidimicrobiales bacterium]